LTTPVKPFDGVMVMVDDVLEPGPAITAATELSANPLEAAPSRNWNHR